MLAHRLRRWGNINPALNQRLMFAGKLDHGRQRKQEKTVTAELGVYNLRWLPLAQTEADLQCSSMILVVQTKTLMMKNAGSTLGHRLRRWPNVKPALVSSGSVQTGVCTVSPRRSILIHTHTVFGNVG